MYEPLQARTSSSRDMLAFVESCDQALVNEGEATLAEMVRAAGNRDPELAVRARQAMARLRRGDRLRPFGAGETVAAMMNEFRAAAPEPALRQSVERKYQRFSRTYWQIVHWFEELREICMAALRDWERVSAGRNKATRVSQAARMRPGSTCRARRAQRDRRQLAKRRT